MDVRCSSCSEPWDIYQPRHDAIFETDLDHNEAETWRTLSAGQRLSPRYREKFKAAGYQFVCLDLQGYRTGSLNEILTLRPI